MINHKEAESDEQLLTFIKTQNEKNQKENELITKVYLSDIFQYKINKTLEENTR